MFNINPYIQYIKSFFINNKKQTENNTHKIKKNKSLCSIDFTVNIDNTMDIVCHWPDLDNLDEITINNIATKYAALLHSINTGIVAQDVTSTLSENLESNNPSDRYFVYEVLSKMIDFAKRKKDHDESAPLIKPSNVFQYYHNYQMHK